MLEVTKAAAAATVILAGGLCGANAADMSLSPAYQLESEPMVEFGSGWYLRGDLGYATVSAPLGSPPVMVSGNSGQGASYAPPSASSILNDRTANFGVMGATLGAGYQFNRWFRMDATYDWRQNSSTNINTYNANCAIDVTQTNGTTSTTTLVYQNPACYVVDSVKMQSWTGLINGYADLGTWFGVTPYLGAGIGISHIQSTANEMYYWNDGAGNYGGSGVNGYLSTATGDVVHYGYAGNVGPTQTRNNFSYAFMGGVAYDIAPHLKFDVGYRYLNMGSLSVIDTSGNLVRKTVDSQEVRAGLRWTPDL